jgi:hypothetical protein
MTVTQDDVIKMIDAYGVNEVMALLAVMLEPVRHVAVLTDLVDNGIACRDPNCPGTLMLQETGYVRCWSTHMEDGRLVATSNGGTEDFGEEGDGDEHLCCSTCLFEYALPTDTEIDWR